MLYKNINSLIIEGKEYKIKTDFRDIIPIMVYFEDITKSKQELASLIYNTLYIDKPPITEETFLKAMYFLNVDKQSLMGVQTYNNTSINTDVVDNIRLYSYVKDEMLIISALNQYFGETILNKEYLHWWDFISAFIDLPECNLTNIVRLRRNYITGDLTKEEKKYLNKNPQYKTAYRDEEELNYHIELVKKEITEKVKEDTIRRLTEINKEEV